MYGTETVVTDEDRKTNRYLQSQMGRNTTKGKSICLMRKRGGRGGGEDITSIYQMVICTFYTVDSD